MPKSIQPNYQSINDDKENPSRTKGSSSFRKVYEGNLTAYFIIGIISSSVFFAPFSFNKPLMEAQEQQPFGPCMWIHLISSFIISFVCLWNVFHTPSHGEMYKVIHRWLGRVGLIFSIFGALFGLIAVWFVRKVDMGQSIGLSILAIGQVYWTIKSYLTIRRVLEYRKLNFGGIHSVPTEEQRHEEVELIGKHKQAAINLWVFCLAPVWIRVPRLFGLSANSNLMFLTLLFTTPFAMGAERTTGKGSFWW